MSPLPLPPILFPRDDSSSYLGVSDICGFFHVSKNVCVRTYVCVYTYAHAQTHFLF